MAEIILDVRGEICPAPLYKTREKAKALLPGDQLLVQTDFGRSVRNIMDWAEDNRYRFYLEEPKPGEWLLRIFLVSSN